VLSFFGLFVFGLSVLLELRSNRTACVVAS